MIFEVYIPVLPLMLLERAAATWVAVDLALNFMIGFDTEESSTREYFEMLDDTE